MSFLVNTMDDHINIYMYVYLPCDHEPAWRLQGEGVAAEQDGGGDEVQEDLQPP